MRDVGMLPDGFKKIIGTSLLVIAIGLTCLWGLFA